MNKNKKRVLVVSFDGEQTYFCAMDNNRVVLFDKLLVSLLPSFTSEETSICIFRDGIEFDSGTTYNSQSHIENQVFTGLELIKKENEYVSNIEWHKKDKLLSLYFKADDIIEINKEWTHFEEPEKWLSQISTYRKYGAEFSIVFSEEQEFIEKLALFFNCSKEELMPKKVIFTNSPDGKPNLSKFY